MKLKEIKDNYAKSLELNHWGDFLLVANVAQLNMALGIISMDYAKAKLEEAAEEKEMYKQCFEMFIPADKWDEATEFLSTNGGKLPKDFFKKNNQ